MENQRIKIAEKIAEEVSSKIKEKVSVTVVQKNNNIERIGLNIRLKGQSINISPVIYLDQYFPSIENQSINIVQVAEEVIAIYEAQNEDDLPTDFIFNKEYILKNIYYSVVNKEKNKHLLTDCPYCEVLDLAALFRCCIKNDNNGRYSFLIHNNHMKVFGISFKELSDAAHENTLKLFGCDIQSLNSLFKKMEIDVDETGTGKELWIVSNVHKVEGAALIMYPEIFNKLSQERVNKSDLWILPSSVHELLALEVSSESEVNELKEIVHSVNLTLEKEDFLSNSVYRYKSNSEELIMN